jgi:hypothetical protein
MKTLFLIVAVSAMMSVSAFSQNLKIILKDGEKIEAKRFFPIMPKDDAIKYLAMDGTKQEVQKADLFCMILKKKAVFVVDNSGKAKQGKLLKEVKELSPDDVCSQAIVDAIKQSKVGGAAAGTGVVSFLAWPVGLVTATVVSSTPVSNNNLHLDASKSTDTPYCDCYKKEASKKKKTVTWMGWGLGTTLGVSVSMLVLML